MTYYANIPSSISKSPRNYVRQNTLSLYDGNAKVGEMIIDMSDPAIPVYYVGNISGNVIGLGTGNLSNYSANNGMIGNANIGNLVVTETVDFTATSNVALGNVANLHITGGSNLQVLTTDGAGNLSWTYKVAIGDIKYSTRTADANGWFKMDGRSVASLGLTATQSAAAVSLGIIGTIPNATNRVLKQKTEPVATIGGTNGITVSVDNLPSGMSATADPVGNHEHQFASPSHSVGGYVLAATTPTDPLAIPIYKKLGLPWTGRGYVFTTFYFQANGEHQHTVSLGGSDTALDIENNYLVVNTFVFLGS